MPNETEAKMRLKTSTIFRLVKKPLVVKAAEDRPGGAVEVSDPSRQRFIQPIAAKLPAPGPPPILVFVILLFFNGE